MRCARLILEWREVLDDVLERRRPGTNGDERRSEGQQQLVSSPDTSAFSPSGALVWSSSAEAEVAPDPPPRWNRPPHSIHLNQRLPRLGRARSRPGPGLRPPLVRAPPRLEGPRLHRVSDRQRVQVAHVPALLRQLLPQPAPDRARRLPRWVLHPSRVDAPRPVPHHVRALGIGHLTRERERRHHARALRCRRVKSPSRARAPAVAYEALDVLSPSEARGPLRRPPCRRRVGHAKSVRAEHRIERRRIDGSIQPGVKL